MVSQPLKRLRLVRQKVEEKVDVTMIGPTSEQKN